MRAIVYRDFGTPDVLKPEEVAARLIEMPLELND